MLLWILTLYASTGVSYLTIVILFSFPPFWSVIFQTCREHITSRLWNSTTLFWPYLTGCCCLEGIYWGDQRMEFCKKPFNILGIHFAPLSLPLERRLQVNIFFSGYLLRFFCEQEVLKSYSGCCCHCWHLSLKVRLKKDFDSYTILIPSF